MHLDVDSELIPLADTGEMTHTRELEFPLEANARTLRYFLLCSQTTWDIGVDPGLVLRTLSPPLKVYCQAYS